MYNLAIASWTVVFAGAFAFVGYGISEILYMESRVQALLEQATVLKLQQDALNCEANKKKWKLVQQDNKAAIICVP